MFVIAPQDTDNDGAADFRDADSDNDGVSDFEESGASDNDGDGRADELVASVDIPDRDLNGVPDIQQASPGVGLRTGISGSGCSVLSSNTDNRVDPTLLLLTMLSLLMLLRQWRVRCWRGAAARLGNN